MRGIIRYLSRRKRLEVRAYFLHFMTPSVSSLSSKFLPPPNTHTTITTTPVSPSPPSFLRVLAGCAPPTQASLTPNLCSCKSALRKSLEEHSLLEAVQDPLSLSAGAPQGSHRHYFIPLKLSHL